MFHLFEEVQDLVCAYALVEILLACGLFHTALINDVTSPLNESYDLIPPREINWWR